MLAVILISSILIFQRDIFSLDLAITAYRQAFVINSCLFALIILVSTGA